MAITYRTAAETAASSTSPRSVSTTGVTSGDLVILAVCLANNIGSANITPPSGFSLIADSSVADTPSIHLYSKVAGGSEPASYSVSWTGGGNGSIVLLAIYSSLALTLNVDDVGAQHNASGDRLWPSINATYANEFLACFAVLGTNTATTPHAGMDERIDQANGVRGYLMTETLGSSGATGTRTGTGTASTSSTVSITLSEQAITAGANITLDAVTLSATGTVAIQGAADITLGAVTVVATGLLPPPAATGFEASPITTSRIDLAWQYEGQTINGWQVERSPNGEDTWTLLDTLAADAREYSDEGLAANTRYYYRVRPFRS